MAKFGNKGNASGDVQRPADAKGNTYDLGNDEQEFEAAKRAAFVGEDAPSMGTYTGTQKYKVITDNDAQ